MAESNIYDLVISELILKADGAGVNSSSSVAQLVLSNSLNVTEVQENYNGPISYTSNVYNIPAGYSVKASTHTITYPNGATQTVSSSAAATGAPTTLILGVVGSTFVVNATATLEKSGSADIVLTTSMTITSVLPLYYGVKANSLTPTTAGLSQQANSNHEFILTTSTLGRLYIVLPTGAAAILTVKDPNGNLYPASDFDVTVSGSYKYYILKWDILLTGANLKYFTINFS